MEWTERHLILGQTGPGNNQPALGTEGTFHSPLLSPHFILTATLSGPASWSQPVKTPAQHSSLPAKMTAEAVMAGRLGSKIKLATESDKYLLLEKPGFRNDRPGEGENC